LSAHLGVEQVRLDRRLEDDRIELHLARLALACAHEGQRRHGYSLISTSTPAASSSFISASTVCGVGSRMSMSRLCVRISNCSRDFLSMCGPRSTVNLLIDVGSGIGPATRAPVRMAVSTISPALMSRSLKSYAFMRMRIFCVGSSAMLALRGEDPLYS